MNQINELICHKIENNTVLSSMDVALVVEELVKQNDLKNYIRDICLSSYNDKIVGEYSCEKRQLVYNAKSMNYYVKMLFNNCTVLYDESFYKTFYLFCQLVTIFHEVRHAIQCKKSETFSRVPKEYLLSNIIYDCLTLSPEKYSSFYRIIPVEKDAELFAYSEVINLLREVLGDDHTFFQKIKDLYNSVLYCGYFNHHKGTLENFYVDVLNKPLSYIQYSEMTRMLTLYEKLGFNFDITKRDNDVISGFFEKDVMQNPIKVFSKK